MRGGDGILTGKLHRDTNSRLTTAITADSTCTTYSTTGYAPFDHAYTYDNLHNLTSLDGPTYTYGTGNTSADGDAGPHAVVEIGTTIDFGYDDNGNRITKTLSGATTTYTYNPENRLAAVDLPSDANDVTFVYDADGNRVKRTHGTSSTVYVAGLMEIDRTGPTVTETRTFYGLAGVPVAVRTHVSAATTFVFQNHLASTVTAWDDTSNTHIRQYYYPYGAERHAVGTLPVDQRYTGQTSDATTNPSGGTGLLFYNARYYDPTTGAFAAADTIIPTLGISAGLNCYAYVNDNPVRFSDPSGHNNWDPTISRVNRPGNAYVGIDRGRAALEFTIERMRDAARSMTRLSAGDPYGDPSGLAASGYLWGVFDHFKGDLDESIQWRGLDESESDDDAWVPLGEDGWEYYIDVFANIAAGYAGAAAGFEPDEISDVADLHDKGGPSKTDRYSVTLGASLWKKHGENLTTDQLELAIVSARSMYVWYFDYYQLDESPPRALPPERSNGW